GTVPMFFTSSSPLVVDGLCIAQLGGRQRGGILALDFSTGYESWELTGDGGAYGSPALVHVGNTKLIVADNHGKMVALNAADGKLVWETPFTPARMNYNASSPIVDGQTVIYGGGGRGFKAVKFEKNGDTIVAKELWSNSDKSVQYNTPVLKGGRLYGLSQNNEFFCLDAQDGKTLWTASAGLAAPPPPAREMKRGSSGKGERKGDQGKGGSGGMRGRGGSRGGYGSIVDAGSVLLALTPSSDLIVFE